MTAESTKLADLVDMEDRQSIFAEVRTLVLAISPGFDFHILVNTYQDVIRLFQGNYPGYRPCNTEYHDLRHTMDVFLAMARLIHGAFVEGRHLTDEEINLGLIAALMHDTGYIQTVDDDTGTGAKYTLVHIQRSIEFARHYFTSKGFFQHHQETMTNILNCTGFGIDIHDIPFPSRQIAMLGKMLGTADLLGQMADRAYLERLLFLFDEFVEGNLDMFLNEFDLLYKTLAFYKTTKKRLIQQLGRVHRYMRPHFRQRWHIDRDLYADSMENNITYLRFVLREYETDYRHHLRRLMAPKTRHPRKVRPV